jgi:hypothetical protein
MTLGQIVDFCVECANRRIKAAGETRPGGKSKAKRRKATQADWDRFWG